MALDRGSAHGERVRVIAQIALAALVATLLIGPAVSAATSPLQGQIDAAEPGSVIDVPAGTYEGTLNVTKPLTLRAQGDVVLDGAGEPALRVRSGAVVVRNLTLASEGRPAVLTDASWIDLTRVTLDAPDPITVRNVAWLRTFSLVEHPFPTPSLRASGWVEGHLLDIRVRYGDGSPYPDAEVVILDEGRQAARATTATDGWADDLRIADRFQRADDQGAITERGTNVTHAVVNGERVPDPVEPELGQLDVEISVVQPPAGADVQIPTIAIVVTGVIGGLAGAIAILFRVHEGFRWRFLVFFAPLYTRLARSELLEHDTRDEIYAHLSENPGNHLRGIKRDLELKHGTLLHHLRMLEDQEMITSVKDGMYRRYYVVGQAERAPEATPSMTDRVAQFIQAQPGTTNQLIAEAMQEPPSKIHYHVTKLVDDGRIIKQRDGREVQLYPVEHGEAQLGAS